MSGEGTETGAAMRTVHAVVKGRVQGVWFRGWTVDQAIARGLSGWVRNRMDGTVEALIHGPAAQVNGMLEALWQGPPSARVDDVAFRETDETPGFSGFRQYPTK